MNLPSSLVLVGAGKMGGALLQGWLRLGLKGSACTVLDPSISEEILQLGRTNGIKFNPDLHDIKPPDVLVLAIKPQILSSASPDLAIIASSQTIVISVLAGKTLADLHASMPYAGGIIRAMPNTPAAIGQGITGAFAGTSITSNGLEMATTLLQAIGKVEWLKDEDQIDAVTAVSGSGPAYVFYLVECLEKAAIEVGLPPEIARHFARATLEGSGQLLAHMPNTTPQTLRQNVTSPGGTTAAALDILMAEDGLETLIIRAVHAAKNRARQLAG